MAFESLGIQDIDMKRVEEILVERGYDVDEMMEYYIKAGSHEGYELWAMIYGHELAERWVAEREGINLENKELMAHAIVFMFINYVDDIKRLG